MTGAQQPEWHYRFRALNANYREIGECNTPRAGFWIYYSDMDGNLPWMPLTPSFCSLSEPDARICNLIFKSSSIAELVLTATIENISLDEVKKHAWVFARLIEQRITERMHPSAYYPNLIDSERFVLQDLQEMMEYFKNA